MLLLPGPLRQPFGSPLIKEKARVSDLTFDLRFGKVANSSFFDNSLLENI